MFLAEEDLDGARSQLIFKLRTSEVVEDERANTRLVNAVGAELGLGLGLGLGLVNAVGAEGSATLTSATLT